MSDRTRVLASSLEAVWQDVRMAARLFRRAPAFAATIVLTLALGVGANGAIFAVANGLLLRPLPVADPHRLVTISSDSAIARGHRAGFGWSFAMWKALQPHVALFDSALAWKPTRFNLAPRGERQTAEGIFASGEYFATLGVRAALGRLFSTGDDRPEGGPDGPVAVISYGLWQRRFGRDPGAVGAPMEIEGVRVTIIGVTQRGFSGVDVGRDFEVALPLQVEPLIRPGRSSLRTSPLLVMLRLARGQSIEEGTAAIRAAQPQILGVTRQDMTRVRPAHYQEPFTLAPAATGTSLPVRGPLGMRDSYQRPLVTMAAVALLVLLIACLNIANLLLARGAARRHELSVRLAIGAPRTRLGQLVLVESLVLAAAGAVGGLGIAAWGSRALVAQVSMPGDPFALDLSFDWRVLAFTAALACASAAIFGTAPALRATRIAPMDALTAYARTSSPPARISALFARLPSGLLLVHVAVSLALVIAATLLVRSFTRLSDVPLGFDHARVLLVNVGMERTGTDPAKPSLTTERIVDAARTAPGVAHVGGAMWTPLDGGMRMGDSEHRVAFNFVTPGWFAAYGTTIRNGRDFTTGDTSGAPPVAIVNDAFVRALMPGRSPLGSRIPYPRSRTGRVQRTIVGVVDDAVFDSQREGIQPIVYLPVAQSSEVGPGGLTGITLGVRPVSGAPMQIARGVGAALRAVDPDISFDFRLLTDHVDASIRQERLVAGLSGFFGALALVMAAVGVYGVTSYTVNRRVRDIGIHVALGARPLHVLALVAGVAMTPVGLGILLGLAAAAALTRSLRALLFGLTPLDPASFAGAAALFVSVAALAASIPAYRATRIDPLVALRDE